jgi:hypothetical protein
MLFFHHEAWPEGEAEYRSGCEGIGILRAESSLFNSQQIPTI